MKQFNINFWEACKKINKDFDLRLGTHYPRAKIEKEKKEIAKMEDYGPPQIQVVKKAWDKKSLAYWKQFGISKKTLEFYKVHNVDKVYSNKYLTMRSTEKNPIFAYVHSTNEVKTYRPLEKRKHKKWGGNMTKNTVGGYDQLPLMGDLLIITKSHKDVMLLHELDYHAVCPSAEGTPIYKKFMDEFQAAFERIVIFYDNDEAGISGAKKLSKKYNLEMIFLPEDEPKDISDFYHKYGKVWTINILEKLLNNDKIPNNSKNRDDES